MNKVKALLIIPIALLLSACVGEEPNDIAYVTALGIDKAENNFEYTIQFANPTKISGGASEEGGTGGNIVENIVVEAPSVYAGISNADAIVSKDLSLSHAKIIVVSEEVAREGLYKIADVISRNNEIRPDVFIAVAENAGDYLEGVKPVIELNPVKYYQLTYQNKNGGAVPQNPAADFYMDCVSGDRDCVLPLAGIAGAEEDSSGTDAGSGKSEGNEKPSKNTKNENAEVKENGFQKGKKNYFAGEAGAEIKNKSETLGLAVFKGDKYVGKLGSIDAQLYNILVNNMKGSKITFAATEDTQMPISVSLEEKRKPHFKIDKEQKRVKIFLKLESELLSAPTAQRGANEEKDYDRIMAQMVSEAAVDFLNRVYKEMNVDIIGIKGKTKRQFLTNEDYRAFKDHFEPKEWTFDVKTDLRLKRVGMTYNY